MEASAETFRIRTDDVAWQIVEQEIIILDSRSWRYLGVGGSGKALWPEVVGGATEDQLAGSLVETFGIDEGRARADVREFVRMLADFDLLEKEPGGV